MFATDVIYRKGQNVPLLPIVEQALQVGGGSVERVVVLARAGDRARRITISRGTTSCAAATVMTPVMK